MGFRLVPKSVTLNDLERRNGRCIVLIIVNNFAQFCTEFKRMTPEVLYKFKVQRSKVKVKA